MKYLQISSEQNAHIDFCILLTIFWQRNDPTDTNMRVFKVIQSIAQDSWLCGRKVISPNIGLSHKIDMLPPSHRRETVPRKIICLILKSHKRFWGRLSSVTRLSSYQNHFSHKQISFHFRICIHNILHSYVSRDNIKVESAQKSQTISHLCHSPCLTM